VPTTEQWKRLGELLVRRRIELDPRYANRQTFTTERGILYRTVGDLEHGARSNYDSSTLAAAEVAYGLQAGAIAAALGGAPLVAAAAEQAAGRSRPTGPLTAVPDAADEDAVIELLIANEQDPERRGVLERTWGFKEIPKKDRLVMLRALLERGIPDEQGKQRSDIGS
jgi:hypothetical protein